MAVKELKDNIDDLKTGGYQIHLTIDLEAQKIAKDALRFGYQKIVLLNVVYNLLFYLYQIVFENKE
jgi:cell division protein FtsI/penicillin-binding protein 2